MTKKEKQNILLSFTLLLLLAVGSVIFLNKVQSTPEYQTLWQHVQNYFGLYVVGLIMYKILGILWPPIPGSVLTFAAIPLIGWQWALLAEVVGGVVGAACAFQLSRHYGSRFVLRFFGQSALDRIYSIKIRQQHELEALVVIRSITGMLTEAFSYGLGLLNINFRKFLLATIISYIGTIPVFYLGSKSIEQTVFIIPTVAFVVLLTAGMYMLRERYFE